MAERAPDRPYRIADHQGGAAKHDQQENTDQEPPKAERSDESVKLCTDNSHEESHVGRHADIVSRALSTTLIHVDAFESWAALSAEFNLLVAAQVVAVDHVAHV
jgi:hypothetical protein